jgi:hypothetical protein
LLVWLKMKSDERDPGRAEVCGEVGELLHRPEARIHLPIARHGVAAVVVAVGGVEQRHEVQIGQAELAEVRDLVADAGEVAGESIHIGDAAEHALGLEPAGIRFALRVAHLELQRPCVPRRGCRGHRRGELLLPIGPLAVERVKRPCRRGNCASKRSRNASSTRPAASAASRAAVRSDARS